MKSKKRQELKRTKTDKNKYVLIILAIIAVIALAFLIYKMSITAKVVETLQPNAASGKDTFIKQNEPTKNFGTKDKIEIDSEETNKEERGLLYFDLSSIPSDAIINSATLYLYQDKGEGKVSNIVVHRITTDWTENGATWNSPWATAGGDYDSTIFASADVGKTKGWYSWDITALIQGWTDGTWPNYGMIMKPEILQSGNNIKKFISSDHAKKSSQRPKLVIDYSTAPPINDTEDPVVSLDSPDDNHNSSTSTIDFICSATDNMNLANITWQAQYGIWYTEETQTVSGLSATAIFTKTIDDGIYDWNCYACDSAGNCAFASENRTINVDATIPGTVIGLNEGSAGQTWIYWTWFNPTDTDFDHVEIWIDGVFITNTSNDYYNATGLVLNTTYEISTRTADVFGNINTNWINDTAKTTPCTENWAAYYDSCLINDSQLKYYADENACGTYDYLPGDNGTYAACNYCSENITGPFNTTCAPSDELTQYYVDANYDECCAITGLIPDCSMDFNSSYFNQTFPCIYDIDAPIIGDIDVVATSSSATITWTTDENANSSINYGKTTSLGTIKGDSGFTTGHSIVLSSLSSNTLYYYSVTSCDISGNCNTKGIYNFTTETSGGGGGGGGGGYINDTASTVYTPSGTGATLCDLTTALKEKGKGTCSNMLQGGSIYFKLYNKATSIIMDAVDDDGVSLSVNYGVPNKIVLVVGQSKEIDLDADKINDISVKLDSIKDNKATITADLLVTFKPAAAGTCPVCPECAEWTACENGKQMRMCYKCSSETNFVCVAYTEEQLCTEAFSWLWYLLLIPVAAVIVYLIYAKQKGLI